MVFIWEHVDNEPGTRTPLGPLVAAHLVNSSHQPVYDAELLWHRGSASHGEPCPELLPTIMPGDDIARSRDFPLGTDMGVSGAVLRFRDAAGITWMRRPHGELIKQQ